MGVPESPQRVESACGLDESFLWNIKRLNVASGYYKEELPSMESDDSL